MRLAGIDLDHYQRLRPLLRKYHHAITSKFSASTIKTCAEQFGLLEGDQLLLETDDELIILMDYCIYSHRPRGKTAVERYLAKIRPSDDPDEQLVRHAMASARYSLFIAERIHKGVGATMYDRIRDERLFLVDISLSQTLVKGQHYAGRLLPLEGHWISSGAGFPLDPSIVAIAEQLLLPLLPEVNREPLSPQDDTFVALILLGLGFESGATTHVHFQ